MEEKYLFPLSGFLWAILFTPQDEQHVKAFLTY